MLSAFITPGNIEAVKKFAVKTASTYKAGQAAQKKPAPRRPVPSSAAKPGDTVNILGMQVPKPAAYLGGFVLLTALGIAASRAMSRN